MQRVRPVVVTSLKIGKIADALLIQLKTVIAMAMDTPVLIVGAGPIGLVLASELAHHGVRCILAERNFETTRWPKMDLTNCRTMELMRRLGLADALRTVGVPSNHSFDVKFSTGLAGHLITNWKMPSVDEARREIVRRNDGTLPREPYQRCSQAIFEAWLKEVCIGNPLIDVRSGWRCDSVEETDDGVVATFDVGGETHQLTASYVVGCDGASSVVRRSLGIGLDGGPVPGYACLVHFKSRDLSVLHAQGQFWHIFFAHGAVIIAQDEVDTWTVHKFFPLDVDPNSHEPHSIIKQSILHEIRVDEILVNSIYRPTLAVADSYGRGRIFLAGDSAHQNIPTGGYGMNTGVGDAVDIGWKLAAVINGWGGRGLLDSYGPERRPVAARNVERSGRHFRVHERWWSMVDRDLIDADTEAGRQHRATIADFIQSERGENEDIGVELGYRYGDSPVIAHPSGERIPHWLPGTYTPTTWPGGRPPSIFLSDGRAIFDLFGPEFTLVDFHDDDSAARPIVAAANRRGLPLTHLRLHGERRARSMYERALVLVRPDMHVAWRGDEAPEQPDQMIDLVRGVATAPA